MGVPETSDPHEKLNWAGGLVHAASRPLPAERLIQQALALFRQGNDEVGEADAYRVYASFFAAPTIESHREWYMKHGFLDKTATYENRYSKSIEYFQKAAATYSRHNRSDWLTYVYLNMGLTYQKSGDRAAACEAFQISEANFRSTTRFAPEISGAADYPSVLALYKRNASCT